MDQRDGQEQVRRQDGVVSRTRSVEVPLTAVLRAFSGPRVAWTDPAGPDVVGCGAAATVAADGPGRFGAVRDRADEVFDALDRQGPDRARPRLLGGFAFHDAHESDPPWRGFPGAYFLLPRVQATRDGNRTWLTVTGTGPDADPASVEAALDEAVETATDAATATHPPPGIAGTERTPSREEWRRQVAAAVDRIEAGELRKVALATALTADLHAPFRLADVLDRLAETYADCYRFAVDPGMGATFFGATPERLVGRRDRRVETGALAGSIGRGGTPEQDERLARRLRESEKNQHEHRLVADAIRDELAPFAERVTTGEQRMRKLDSVQHLYTPIGADLADDAHVLELVEALHPTPAVGGVPPDAAWRTIKETEAFERGWYAAPVGWFDGDGDGTFAVGIRSAVATDATATLFAGNGIVADSDPDDEWDEVQLKYRPILDHLR